MLMVNNASFQWDKYASLFDETQGETGDLAHQLLFDPKITEMLGDISDKIVLDAGCGNGYWARKLAKRAKKVVGIDSSPKLISIAKVRGNPKNINFQTMDLNNPLVFAKDTFDLILSSMVFHFLPVLVSPVKEFRRILKPQGKVVVCVQHPLYPYHFRAQEKAGKKTNIFFRTAGYFDRKLIKQVTLLGRAVVESYNRPLEDYLKAFLDNGFVLTDFAEPEFTPELLEKNPRYRQVSELPRIVIFQFIKNR